MTAAGVPSLAIGRDAREAAVAARRRWWIGIVVTVALSTLSGCVGRVAVTPAADAATLDRLRAQARSALDRWDAAASVAVPDLFVPTGDATRQIGTWEPAIAADATRAVAAGYFASDLPSGTTTTGTVTWSDGTTRRVRVLSAADALARVVDVGRATGACDGCDRLRITGARLSTARVPTTRGTATAPVWLFTVGSSRVVLSRLAVDTPDGLSAAAPPWNSRNPPVGPAIVGAVVSPDGMLLTVGFEGAVRAAGQPCGKDYRAETAESVYAVVVIVVTLDRSQAEGCPQPAMDRRITVRLSAPLAGRTVLEDQQGQPVPTSLG